MTVDMNAWRDTVKQVVDGIADENFQRRAWFGLGPEISSPDEELNSFFGDAAIVEFLERNDTGLNEPQIEAGLHLAKLMRELSDQTPDHIEPSSLIDNPRWRKIREAAVRFLALLSTSAQ